MKNIIFSLISIFSLCTTTFSEDYQCKNADGCTARITENGVVQEVSFRKNDLVSTEAGWIVSPNDGWEKVKTKDRAPGNVPPSPALVGVVNYTYTVYNFPGQRVVVIQPIMSGLNDTGVISRAVMPPTTIIFFPAP